MMNGSIKLGGREICIFGGVMVSLKRYASQQGGHQAYIPRLMIGRPEAHRLLKKMNIKSARRLHLD